IATLHLHPRDVGGAIVSLDQPRPPESWRWGGPEWQSHVRTDVVDGITSVTLDAENAERLAARWTEVLGLWTPRRAGTTFELALEGGGIRFVPAAGSHARRNVRVAAPMRVCYLAARWQTGSSRAASRTSIARARRRPSPLTWSASAPTSASASSTARVPRRPASAPGTACSTSGAASGSTRASSPSWWRRAAIGGSDLEAGRVEGGRRPGSDK